MAARAPYNFIGFSYTVIERYHIPKELPSFEKFHPHLLTGYITYKVENETDLFIGDGKGAFFTDIQGNLAIPGSTMRGLIRNNVEILGFSYPEFVDDILFMYRKFADKSKKLNTQYAQVISTAQGSNTRIPEGVKVGYIYWKDKETLVLAPAEEIGKDKRTFFRIHEKELREKMGNKLRDQYMYSQSIPRFRYEDKKGVLGRIKEAKESERKRLQKDLFREIQIQLQTYNESIKKKQNKAYNPYRCKISFDLIDQGVNGKIGDIDTRNTKGYEGYLLNSQGMNGKTHHYIVSEMSQQENMQIFTLCNKQVLAYVKDYTMRCIQNKKLSDEFYNLPYRKEGVEMKKLIGKQYAKPFFYKLDKDGKTVLGFGPTPYFRIYYKHSTGKGIPCKKPEGIDYAKALFGYVDASDHYKSRLQFTHCSIQKATALGEKVKVTLASPKPTSFQLYLDQQGKSARTHEGYTQPDLNFDLNNYNDPGFKLRGNKFYWMQKEEKPVAIGSDTMDSVMEPLKKNAVFAGKIYFENLHPDELGLLLLALKVDETTRHNIGMAKPYGYGKIDIKDMELYMQNTRESFTNVEPVYKKTDIQEYIDAYKQYIQERGIVFDQHPRVKEYIIAKSYEPSDNEATYMADLKEIAKREVLPTPEEIKLGQEKEKKSMKSNGRYKQNANHTSHAYKQNMLDNPQDHKQQNKEQSNYTDDNKPSEESLKALISKNRYKPRK